MRLVVSGVSLAASRSRSAPTPLAKNTRDEEEEDRVGLDSMFSMFMIIKKKHNSSSRSAPTPLAKNTGDDEEEEPGLAKIKLNEIIKKHTKIILKNLLRHHLQKHL